MSEPAPTYRFAPHHEAGAFGLARSQLATLGVGIVLALVAVLGARRPIVGLAVVVAGAALAFAPLAGRPLVSWIGPLAAGLANKQRGVAPLARHELHFGRGLAPGASRPRGESAPPITWHLPGLRRLVLRAVASPLGEVGVADVSGGQRSAALTFSISGPRFGLVDVAGQARALGAWGQLLGSLARDGRDLHRLQLTEKITPDDLAAPWQFVAGGTSEADAAALAVYRDGLEVLGGRAVRHEVLLTVSLEHRGSGREQIARECGRIAALLDGAGFAARPLDQIGLAHAIIGALDPERPALPEALAADPAALAPRAWRSCWGSIRTDSGVHACFEATGLPRLPVGPQWAWPLVLGEAPIKRRSLTLHVELARPELAIRRAERAVVSHESDEAMRARFGFRSGARDEQAHDAALDREAELVAGYADARFALLASVSATSEEELAASCRALVSQAAASHVDLRRLYRRQGPALVSTLPLGVVNFRGGWR